MPVKNCIYLGTFIDTPTTTSLRVLENTAIGVDLTGRIAFIRDADPRGNDIAQLASQVGWVEGTYTVNKADASGKHTSFYFPGFIDTHTHASQYPNTGIFGSSTLLSWLETYTFPLESSYADPARARLVYTRVVERLLSNGTTCAAYYATIHPEATNLLADICFTKGQRALVGRVCMDRMSPPGYRDESVEAAIRDSKNVIAHISKRRAERSTQGEEAVDVQAVITPRFAPSCTDACLKALGDLHKETGLPVQTHISENKSEIALVKELFPASQHYTGVYDEAGLLGDKTILAHAVHLSEEELALISKRKAKISHCPASNTCLTSGAARIRDMLDKSIDVGLGTDMSGGYSPSILEMARQAMLVSRHVAMHEGDTAKLSIEEVLYLATRGGAKVVGLEDKVGAFEVGMEFDAQLVALDNVVEDDADMTALGPVDIFPWVEKWEDRIAKWLYIGDDRNVAAVWVKGCLVHHNKHLSALKGET